MPSELAEAGPPVIFSRTRSGPPRRKWFDARHIQRTHEGGDVSSDGTTGFNSAIDVHRNSCSLSMAKGEDMAKDNERTFMPSERGLEIGSQSDQVSPFQAYLGTFGYLKS